jgi:CRISPR/Cas system CMR subunit Cmr6 (Cas7 group RAMP superfamily)
LSQDYRVSKAYKEKLVQQALAGFVVTKENVVKLVLKEYRVLLENAENAEKRESMAKKAKKATAANKELQVFLESEENVENEASAENQELLVNVESVESKDSQVLLVNAENEVPTELEVLMENPVIPAVPVRGALKGYLAKTAPRG